MRDEYPGEAFLSPAEVRKLLKLRDTRAFRAFVEEHPQFPKQVAVGKTAKGAPRMLYRKEQIYAFVDMLGG